MRVTSYVYDSRGDRSHVEAVLALVEPRSDVDLLDVGAAEDPAAARREAMLVVKGAVRVGRVPAALFDETGRPDFSPGALVTEAPTGRRRLHVGRDALEVLQSDG